MCLKWFENGWVENEKFTVRSDFKDGHINIEILYPIPSLF